MKKFFLMLLALPMLMMMASCEHTDDVNVNFSVDFGPDVTVVDGKAYVAKNGTFEITAVRVAPVNTNHAAAITQISYWINGLPLVPTINVAPFGIQIAAENMREGSNSVTLDMTVIETDCPISNAITQIPVVVVDNVEDIPTAGVQSSTNVTVAHHMK